MFAKIAGMVKLPTMNDKIVIILNEIKRRGKFYDLCFANGDVVHATKSAIDRHDLAAAMSFSLSEYEEIKQILEKDFAFATGESILARRAHSVGEFKQKLRQKQVADEHIAEVVRDFKSRDLLDDLAYGKLRINSIINRKPAGKGFLIAELQKKLIPREIAQEIIEEVLGDQDEVDVAVEILEKKRISLEKFDLETARKKAYNYLSRRAISYQASKEAFERLFTGKD